MVYKLILEDKKLGYWSERYFNHIERNIGPIKVKEQELLRTSNIGILGVGGLGGPLVEQLVRAGCQNLTICDWDEFDVSNLNRQICTVKEIGCSKVDVTAEFLKRIDPEVVIKKYYKVNEENIVDLVKNLDVVALTLDDLATSILIARECRKRAIPMVESWGIPCLFAWWFMAENMDYEACYGLNTHHLGLEELKKEFIIQNLQASNMLLSKIFHVPGLRDLYDREPEMFNDMISGAIPLRSFAPFVRLSASYLAIEVIFAGLLSLKPKILAPQIKGFDYIRMNTVDFIMDTKP
jgi:hypothetical protein